MLDVTNVDVQRRRSLNILSLELRTFVLFFFFAKILKATPNSMNVYVIKILIAIKIKKIKKLASNYERSTKELLILFRLKVFNFNHKIINTIHDLNLYKLLCIVSLILFKEYN